MRPDPTIQCGEWLAALAAQAVQTQRLWNEHQQRALGGFGSRQRDLHSLASGWLNGMAPPRLWLQEFTLSAAVQFTGRRHRQETVHLRPLNLGAELRHEASAETQSRLTLTVEQVPVSNARSCLSPTLPEKGTTPCPKEPN